MAAGCKTTHSEANPAEFVSVFITGKSPQQIASATTKAFHAEGYSGGQERSGQLVFDKRASAGTTFIYEGMVAAGEGNHTVYRARVDIVPMDDGAHRLQCQAYIVKNAGDSVFEDQIPMRRASGPIYQDILKKAARQLQ